MTNAIERDTDGAAREATSTTTILVNSTIAAVLATALTILIHELVHLVTGLAMGHGGTLVPFGVAHDGTLTDGQTALAAISAPIVSLLLGAAIVTRLPNPARAGFGHLLLFWLGATSLMEGAGYLVITPFGVGDTAVTRDALGLPGWTGILAALLGFLIMLWGARALSPHVVGLVGTERSRTWALAFHPWWIGTLVNVALALVYVNLAAGGFTDAEKGAVVAAGTALLVLGPMSFLFQKSEVPDGRSALSLPAVPVAGVVALAAMIGLNLALLSGWHVG